MKHRIDSENADTIGQSRVAAGLVDPYFHEIADRMRAAWHPRTGDMGEDGADGPMAGVKALVHGWAAVGKQWARTGSPFPDGKKPDGIDYSRPTVRPPGGSSGFDAEDFVRRWNDGEFAFSGGLVLLELIQTHGGQAVRIRILQSSGFKLFDQAAQAAVVEAAKSHLPPPHGLGLGGPTIRSLWRMEARMVPNTCSFVPDSTGISRGAGFLPGIQCGGTFDPSLHDFDFDQPLKTRVIAKVDLLAVYGGETRPVAQ